MPTQLLLLEDVDDLGRSGDIVNVKPGFARNFLVPKRKAVHADQNARRMQARLQEERAKQAVVDKKEAEELADKITALSLVTIVKVDQEGHMYGSVSAVDIVKLLGDQQVLIERRNVVLAHPVKATGVHKINLKLKEGVPAQFVLKIIPEGMDEATFDAKQEAAALEAKKAAIREEEERQEEPPVEAESAPTEE